MTLTRDKYRLQRFLVYVLRHNPDKLGLKLGSDGFVPIAEILAALRQKPKYAWVDAAIIEEIVTTQPDKLRLQIDNERIRARYGHSSRAISELVYTPVPPPEHLYHGTALASVNPIQEHGLLARSRKYVHLSATPELAQRVGNRHSHTVVIIVVLSQQAHQAGIEFYNPESQIWLASHIPPQFLQIP